MTIEQRIAAFTELGGFLEQFQEQNLRQDDNKWNTQFYHEFNELITTVNIYNPWFTENNVRTAISGIVTMLNEKALNEWIDLYGRNLFENKKPKRIAVIMAGNIPMVGFHDMLCVLISGNKFVGKLSSEDQLLLPYLAKILIAIAPEFANYIEFTTAQIKNIDAVIATGSDNTSRYFEYYFGKYPHIIRKNRNSVAVITGKETMKELRLLGKDIFQYFGLGCRNVSKLFVPKGYDFDTFYKSIFEFQSIINNNKYGNNYDYNRTVYLMASPKNLLDNNFLLLKEDTTYTSPIGVLFYEFYNDLDQLSARLTADKELIQCIVAQDNAINNAFPFGQAQCPQLNDYADGVDTMKFLLEL